MTDNPHDVIVRLTDGAIAMLERTRFELIALSNQMKRTNDSR
jgi:hypothetical protein